MTKKLHLKETFAPSSSHLRWAATWDKLTQILEEVGFTDGKIYVKLTRKERANNVKKRNYFTRYGEQSRKVLEALPDKYADEGIENIERMEHCISNYSRLWKAN